MSEVQERIAQLVERGRVSPGEAKELLGAVQPARRSLPWRLVDPFESLDVPVGLAIAGAVALAQVVLSRFAVRFDGALDMHLVPKVPSLAVALLDLLVSWPLLSAVLWVSARLVAKGSRLIDLLWAVGVARAPLVLGAVANRLLIDDPEALARSAVAGQPHPALLWVALITLPLMGWMLLWLFFGYRTASGARGARSGVTFVIGILAAEIASKALLTAAAALGVS